MENTAFFYYDDSITTYTVAQKESVEVLAATPAKHGLSGLKNEKRYISREGVTIAGQIVILGP